MPQIQRSPTQHCCATMSHSLNACQLSVEEIGIEPGFSDPRQFRRAFKRWTGTPPQEARRSLR
jgi:transcriptional regulator GlxA family with amidase domain